MPHIRDLEAVREQVRGACDLVEVMESYGHEFQQVATDNVATICPFHQEAEPSFAVSLSKQVYLCYGCKEKGDVFTFVQFIEGISHIDAVRTLAEFGGIDLRPYESAPTPQEREQARLYSVLDKVQEVCRKGVTSKLYVTWRTSRLFDQRILDEYGVGFADGPIRLRGHEDDLESLGMDPKRRNQWANVITVPIRDEHGRICAYRNRPLEGPKSVAARKEYPLPIPPIYGFSEAKRAVRKEAGRLYLVEGEGDVWQMRAHGYENVCASVGSSLSEDAVEFLAERGVREIIVIPDGDKAGRLYGRQVAKIRRPGVSIKIATLVEGDPDDVLLRDPALLEYAVSDARFGIDYLIREVLDREVLTLSDKIEVLEELRPVFASVTLAEEQMGSQILARELGVDETYVLDFFRGEDESSTSMHDVRSERTVLTRMLRGDEFTGEAALGLTVQDFYLKKHQQIFESIQTLYRAGHTVTSDTLEIQLERAGADQAARYVVSLAKGGDDGASAFMLQNLRDKSQRRQARDVAKDIVARVTNPTLQATQVLQTAMGSLSKIVVGNGRERDIGSVVDAEVRRIHERMANPNVIVGIDLGMDWQSLNRTIHGLQPGRYFVFAGPSNDGKTMASVSWMSRIAVDLQVPTLVLSFETGRESLVQRITAHRSGVELEKMATGYISEEDIDLIHDAARQISAAPLYIEERGRVFEEAQALIQHNILSRGVQLVILDYIQLMTMADNRERAARHEVLGRISRGLLEICMETEVSVMALAQQNREGSKKKTGADHTDIGESFKIAQDADIFVSFASKTKEDIEMDGVEKGNRRAVISKNRKDGPVGVVWNMSADTAIQRVREIPT